MSWKKWKSSEGGGDEEPIILEYQEDRREFFRVRPDPMRPAFFVDKAGQSYRIRDISAGGAAVEGEGLLPGQRLTGLFRLPGLEEPVPAVVEVLDVRGGIARTRVAKIQPRDQEKLHYYVLLRQKEEMAARRRQQQPPQGPADSGQKQE